MCFSAQASFFAAALLFSTFTGCLLKASKPSHGLLALVPFFFGVQQLAEGILWLLLPKGSPSGTSTAIMYLFLIIAAFGWPLLIPLAGRSLETDPQRKKLLTVFITLALLWMVAGGYQLFAYGATVTIADSHLLYTLYSPYLLTVIPTFYYCTAIILPFFLASNRLFNFLGILTALSCLAAYLFWYLHFISVWCFFAALISIGTYGVVFSLAKQEHQKANP